MSYGWTKKFKYITWQELKDMLNDGKQFRYKPSDKVLYFKIVVREDKCTSEHASLIIKKEVE